MIMRWLLVIGVLITALQGAGQGIEHGELYSDENITISNAGWGKGFDYSCNDTDSAYRLAIFDAKGEIAIARTIKNGERGTLTIKLLDKGVYYINLSKIVGEDKLRQLYTDNFLHK